ncbi:MAG: hypothetical protein CM15mP130_0970 [Verrucomicrobiota bacterium]|nr:MAG: hypothetical protein CM15mP130_0970 [Verrucomicrobiota bacterium]
MGFCLPDKTKKKRGKKKGSFGSLYVPRHEAQHEFIFFLFAPVCKAGSFLEIHRKNTPFALLGNPGLGKP